MKKLITNLTILILFFIITANLKNVLAFNLVSIGFSPDTLNLKQNQESNFDLILSPNSPSLGISGFDICLKYDPGQIQIIDAKTPIDLIKGDNTKFNEVNKKIDNNQGSGCLGYISILPDDELSRKVSLSVTIKGLKSGSGQITVKSAQIVGNIPENLFKNQAGVLRYSISGSDTNLLMRIWVFIQNLLPFLK